jgi:hypothetical protein
MTVGVDERMSVQRQLDNARAELEALKSRFTDALADRDRFQTRVLELEVRVGWLRCLLTMADTV